MDSSLFGVLGKYGGLAGISVGLVLVIFQAVLKKNIFPKLNNVHAYALISQLMYLTFGIGALGIIAWTVVALKGNPIASITGHLTDRDTKEPVPYAEVTLSGRPEQAQSDGAGNFTLSIMNSTSPGPFHLWVRRDGYEPFDRYMALGQNVDAELIPEKPHTEHPHVQAKSNQSLPENSGSAIPTTTWTDAATGLTWRGKDNGSNVDWNEAKNFCSTLSTNGYASGWRLPTISELASLYDASYAGSYIYQGGPNSGNFRDGSRYPTHIKSPVELDSCCAWSGERDGTANALYYRFQKGEQWSFPIDQEGGVVRALCVNGPK